MPETGDIRLTESDGEFVERVERHSLPPSADRLVKEYERVGGERDRYLWKWLHSVFPEFTLSCVDLRFADQLAEAKFCASMFVVLLDDLAERRQDRSTFEEASKIPFSHQTVNRDRPGVDVSVLAFMESVWERLAELLEEAPRWHEFADSFRFDLKRTIVAIEYSYTVNRTLEMANLDEAEVCDSPNMMLFTYVNMDLMHSPQFELADLGTLRRAVHRAQRMARIGNWITTWERELAEGDFSSGVVISALERGIVSPSDLYELRQDPNSDARQRLVERIAQSDVEDAFMRQWEEYSVEVNEFESAIASVDLAAFMEGMRRVMQYHLASRGRK